MDFSKLPAILTPDLGLLFWMLLAFAVVFFVLAKYGFPAITGMVEERKKYIDESLKKAHEASERLENIKQEGEAILQEARDRQAQILKEAAETRDAIVEQAQQKAREEGARLLGDAKTAIEQEKRAAIADIRQQVAALSVEIAEKVLRQNLKDDKAQMDLIERMLDEVSDIGVISVRYARALLKSATDAKIEDAVYTEMQQLAKSYIEVPQLRFTIDNPMLSKDKKEALLLTAVGTKASDLTKAFIQLVLKEDREGVMQFIANSYVTLYRQQKNVIRGRLITAAQVSPATEQKMRQMVESKTNGTVEFETEVNPDIIGGFILEYDTYRMDASVKAKLNSILTQLRK